MDFDQQLYESLPAQIRDALEGHTVLRAMFIARVVRDAMEDFHVEHLSDDQMAQLNLIIRQAITDALVVLDRADDPLDELGPIGVELHGVQDAPRLLGATRPGRGHPRTEGRSRNPHPHGPPPRRGLNDEAARKPRIGAGGSGKRHDQAAYAQGGVSHAL
jgi:hypothetical protein